MQGYAKLDDVVVPYAGGHGYASEPTTTPTYTWAEVDATAAGDNTVVAAIVGKSIRVVAITFTAAAVVTVSFKSAAATTLIDPMQFAAGGGMDVNRAPYGYFCQTATGEALVFNLSGAVNVRGSLMYQEV